MSTMSCCLLQLAEQGLWVRGRMARSAPCKSVCTYDVYKEVRLEAGTAGVCYVLSRCCGGKGLGTKVTSSCPLCHKSGLTCMAAFPAVYASKQPWPDHASLLTLCFPTARLPPSNTPPQPRPTPSCRAAPWLRSTTTAPLR